MDRLGIGADRCRLDLDWDWIRLGLDSVRNGIKLEVYCLDEESSDALKVNQQLRDISPNPMKLGQNMTVE